VSSCKELTQAESFIIQKLKVQSDVVYEFKALRAKYDNLYENQLYLLIKAHKWNEAHFILSEHVAPEYFIKGTII
jgi:hypothetical protein